MQDRFEISAAGSLGRPGECSSQSFHGVSKHWKRVCSMLTKFDNRYLLVGLAPTNSCSCVPEQSGEVFISGWCKAKQYVKKLRVVVLLVGHFKDLSLEEAWPRAEIAERCNRPIFTGTLYV